MQNRTQQWDRYRVPENVFLVVIVFHFPLAIRA